MKTVYLAGSFKNNNMIQEISKLLSLENISNEFSKPGETEGIQGCLRRIEKNDVLLVINPDKIIGKSVAIDLGYALALEKEIYSLEPIEDPPIGNLTKGNVTVEEFILTLKRV